MENYDKKLKKFIRSVLMDTMKISRQYDALDSKFPVVKYQFELTTAPELEDGVKELLKGFIDDINKEINKK